MFTPAISSAKKINTKPVSEQKGSVCGREYCKKEAEADRGH